MSEKLTLHFPQSDSLPYKVLPQGQVVVGRSETCDLDLTQYFKDFQTISREHFKIFYENGCFFIVDLGSTHGTRVSGYPLTKNEARSLWSDDRIELAGDKNLVIVVKIDRGSDATKPIPIDPLLSPILEPLREFKDVMLLGIAGTGKTFLLRKLIYHPETHATPNPPLPEFRNLLFCYVNCMAIDDLSCSSFFKLLIAATKPAFYDWPALIEHNYDLVSQPNCSIIEITNAMLETVKTVQRHHRKCLVFMLDQFDDVYDQLPSEIFLILKDVKLSSSEPQPIYILAMRNELEEDINIHQFLRAMPARCDCWIRPFQVDELEDVASPYMLGPEKLKLSIELGGKQPRLTDLVAASLSKTSKMTGDEREFVEHLLADRQIASHCREMWNSLLPDEQEALRSIANGAPRIQQAIQDRLIREKWVLVKDQDLTFISPLFGAFVKSLLQDAHPLAKSKTETGLLFDENTLEFIIDGKRMSYEDLTKLERDLLLYLYQEAGKVCSFADISNRVWGYGDSEYAASTDSIARLIHGLRKKLDQKSPGAGNRHIINVRGTGYRCVIK